MIPTPPRLRALSRFSLAALPCLLPVAPALATTTDEPVLAWRLDTGPAPPESCGPPAGVALACGARGDYVLAEGPYEDNHGCGATAAGNETPPAFVQAHWPAPAPGEWFPCRDGACFVAEPGEAPWAAVVDWDDPHGWSVGATLLEAADGGIEARLFPLDAPPGEVGELLAPFAVGDAHLLAQLCALAEELETGLAPPPLVVNVSAGRLATGGGENPEELTVAGQVLGVIEHLSSDYGIAFVAAAGHHRAVLFPAHLPPVLAAGPVDLPLQRHTGQVRPSWQADAELRALFPAAGLELYSDEDPPRCWPVPAGTSFASATAAGWIAAYRAADGGWQVADAGAVWAPARFGGRFHLTRDRDPLPGTDLARPSDLVAGAVDGFACDGTPEGPGAVLEVGAAIPNPTLGLPSLVELIDDIGPSPENEPCVPCDIGHLTGPADEVLRLDASRPLSPDYRIVDLYLLTDRAFHRLESPDKQEILEQIEDAALDALELRGFRAVHLQPWHEALLVFQLAAGAHGLWTAAPIDVLLLP